VACEVNNYRFSLDNLRNFSYNEPQTKASSGRMKKKRSYSKEVFQSLVTITQFGLNMIVPIGMMTALGIYLDRKLQTSFWVILLFFAGAAAGARNVYRMAKRIYEDDKNKPKEQEEIDKHARASQNK
jgi:F0F1-type ATP synthase assembly protein I